jgi:large conductance mechanosensitive channel
VADVRERGTTTASESFDSSFDGSVFDLANDGTNGTAFGTIAPSPVDDESAPLNGRVVGGLDFSNHFLVFSNRADAAAPSLVAA